MPFSARDPRLGQNAVFKLHSTPLANNGRNGSEDSLRIGIIGAGIAGLYIALMLDDLAIPGLRYEILEGSSRVGGRIMTHRFSDAPGDYVDIGAMRFPDIPPMSRFFHLIDRLNVPLIPFHYSGTNTPELFNGVLQVGGLGGASADLDPFNFGISRGGRVPDHYVHRGADVLLSEAVRPFTAALAKDFDAGFRLLLEYDDYTLRQYLSERNVNAATITWIETMCSATGLADCSLADAVIDQFFFDYPAPQVHWYAVQNGSIRLVETLAAKICHQPQRHCRVTAMRHDCASGSVTVEVDGQPAARRYSAVLSTTTLGALQRIDLGGLGLPPAQMEAIRSLHYDHSVKIAVKFSYPWWAVRGQILHGGSGRTDLPLRVCVYPSVKPTDYTKPAVLLCSYTWAQDAARLGALVAANGTSPDGEGPLLDLVLRNLAELHGHCIALSELQRAYLTHYSYDWGRDPFASGAFALYGPSQFSQLHPALVESAADGRFYIVGEGASRSHGWVSGSLDSAYQAVDQLLRRFRLDEYCDELRAKWGA